MAHLDDSYMHKQMDVKVRYGFKLFDTLLFNAKHDNINRKVINTINKAFGVY